MTVLAKVWGAIKRVPYWVWLMLLAVTGVTVARRAMKRLAVERQKADAAERAVELEREATVLAGEAVERDRDRVEEIERKADEEVAKHEEVAERIDKAEEAQDGSLADEANELFGNESS